MKTYKTTIELKFDIREIDRCINDTYWGDDDYDEVKLWEKGVADGIWEYIGEEINEICKTYVDGIENLLQPIFEEMLKEVKSQKDYKTKYKKMLKEVLDYFE